MDGPAPRLVPVLRTEQRQLALPALLRMLTLVSVPREELETRVEAELARNPFIERAPGGACVACGRHTARGLCPSCRRARPAAAVERATRRPPLDVLADEVRAELPTALRPLVHAVLGSLDERGLATCSTGDLAADLRCPVDAVQRVIKSVQAVGPPGIGEPTSHACLLAQARWLVDHQAAPAVIITIVTAHLEDVACDDVGRIASVTGASTDTVIEAIGILRSRMRPWITWSAAEIPESAAPPADVIVTTDPGCRSGLRIEVTDAGWFGLRLVELLPQCRTGPARRWAQPWQHQATTFVHQLETRAGALRTVAGALVEAQHEYLTCRRDAPLPLTRTAIASTCELSVSTVSRVVQGKHMRLPRGHVIPMARLFDPSSSARHAVGQALQRCPGLTDLEVSRRLADDGLVIARRTVAKYRAQLGISAFHRSRRREATFA